MTATQFLHPLITPEIINNEAFYEYVVSMEPLFPRGAIVIIDNAGHHDMNLLQRFLRSFVSFAGLESRTQSDWGIEGKNALATPHQSRDLNGAGTPLIRLALAGTLDRALRDSRANLGVINKHYHCLSWSVSISHRHWQPIIELGFIYSWLRFIAGSGAGTFCFQAFTEVCRRLEASRLSQEARCMHNAFPS